MNTLEQLRNGRLLGITRLTLSEGLTEVPHEIFDLAETLEYLDLSGNALATLPNEFDRLQRLQVLFCAGNQFTELPPVLGRCANLSMVGFRGNRLRTMEGAALPPKLRWLILTGNQLETLPAEIGRCTELQKVILSGNRLRHLPVEMSACTKLELLRIAANRFEVLPEWLLRMPRWSWLGYSGNPLTEALERQALGNRVFSPKLVAERSQAKPQRVDESVIPAAVKHPVDVSDAAGGDVESIDAAARNPLEAPALKKIPWTSMQLKQKLGEGASGVIYRAACAGDEQDVAVKVFKGALTSDGLPQSEIAAYLNAGTHPYLINLLGKVSEHPEGTEALVMQLMGANYRTLASPPSLQSCTRDVYEADRRFTLLEALRLAQGLASLAQQLHARGLTHGDLYAHNTLVGAGGHAVLGDFGAAAFYDCRERPFGMAIERLEVRAFGCLFEELLARVAVVQRGTIEAATILKQDETLPPDITSQRHVAVEQNMALKLAEALRDRCLTAETGERPLFKEIADLLEGYIEAIVAG